MDPRYEKGTDDALNFVVRQEARSVGSRSSGKSARTKIEHLIARFPDGLINIDFDEIPMVSSGFADEFLGKLFVRIGALRFMSAIRLRNVGPAVKSVLDRAILQRAQQEAEDT